MMIDSKYVMIVTEEDERYDNHEVGLDFFADAPWEGNLTAIVYGRDKDDLLNKIAEFEGLFFQLYVVESGKRLAYGVIDSNTPDDEIEAYEKGKN